MMGGVSLLLLLLVVLLQSVHVWSGDASVKLLHHPAKVIESVEVSNGNRSNDKYWSKPSNIGHYGDLVNVSSNQLRKQFNSFAENFMKLRKSDDQEAIYAVEKLFWLKTNGIVLEMGAINGVILSESLQMERLGWYRILIEGEPSYRTSLGMNVNSLAYSAAICESAQVVHYAFGKDVGGILEFMSEDYLKMFYPMFINMTRSEWKNQGQVTQVLCVPLKWIFNHRQISHVNFFILDVEGGELQVLKSIDYEKVTFDVISVETEYTTRKFRPLGYAEEVGAFLSARGYTFHRGFGRNSWFIHNSFHPTSRPI